MDSSLKRPRSDAELNRAAVYPAGGRRTLALLGQLTGELSCTADVSTHVRRSPAVPPRVREWTPGTPPVLGPPDATLRLRLPAARLHPDKDPSAARSPLPAC